MLAAQYNKARPTITHLDLEQRLTTLQLSNKVEVNRIDIPGYKDNEILIKTRSASLCHSDLVRYLDLQADPVD